MFKKSSGFVANRAAAGAAWILVALALSSPAAAVIEQLSYRIEVAADGSLTEHRTLRVRLEDREDVETWRAHAIVLDAHRRLVAAEAFTESSSGNRRRLGRHERDEAEYAGEGILFSSRRFMVFEPEALEAGQSLVFETTIAIDPYFPADSVELQPHGEAVENLEIDIRSEAGALRHHILGSIDDALEVVTSAGGRQLRITGALAELEDPLDYAADEPRLLRYAWGDIDTWPGLARWYAGILESVPRGGVAVDRLAAAALVEGLDQRQRLETAVALVRRQIRYVAVEVGIGGYRPSPPEETAERAWGDCKDKSFLLVELLNRAGFKAYPALVRLDPSRRIDRELPSPDDFNHLIVAIDTAGFEVKENDPVSDGLLFIDPTQTTGSASYLHRGVQDQDALVITREITPVVAGAAGGFGRLVRVPTLPGSELIELEADLVLESQGDASGRVIVRFQGETASSLAQRLEATAPSEIEGLVRGVLLGRFPTARLSELTWSGDQKGLPLFEIEATLSFPGAVEGVGQNGSLRLPAPNLLPAIADLDALGASPAALSAGTVRYRMDLHLPPEWCKPEPRDDTVINGAGRFSQVIENEGDTTRLIYEVVLARAWNQGAELAELRELALAEHRAGRRRLRFRCDG